MTRAKRKTAALSARHVEILDHLSTLHYNIPRTHWVDMLIEAGLPHLIEEIAALHTSDGHDLEFAGLFHAATTDDDVSATRRIFAAVQAEIDAPPLGVIDFATRKAALIRKRQAVNEPEEHW